MPGKFDDIEIRQDSIIKRIYPFFMGGGIIEIPKDKITSVTSRVYFNVPLLIAGFIVIALSVFYKMHFYLAKTYLFIIGLIIGIFLVILFFFIKHEEIVIKSPTEVISGRGEGAGDFYKQNKFF